MGYLTKLKWMKDLDEHSDEEQKVLLALSHDQYKWRTKDRLLGLTQLGSKELDAILARLIDKDLIKPTFSAKRNIVFGLRERVG